MNLAFGSLFPPCTIWVSVLRGKLLELIDVIEEDDETESFGESSISP